MLGEIFNTEAKNHKTMPRVEKSHIARTAQSYQRLDIKSFRSRITNRYYVSSIFVSVRTTESLYSPPPVPQPQNPFEPITRI